MMTFSDFGFLKQSVKVFLVEESFFGRFVPIDVKKLLKFSAFSIGSVMVLSSAIMANALPPFCFFLEDMISCISCHIVLESFLFCSK